jgi:hypothetical protein
LPADWEPKYPVCNSGNPFISIEGNADSAELFTTAPEVFSQKNPWLDAVIYLLNQVQRADLDMYNISVNGGTNLRRFSEYAPKGKPLRPANLDVQENTTAYVRGEIRPVQGQPDSLITRWVIRYDQPLLHESGLRILGFSAADAPDIEYDTTFSDWQAVKDISGGDLDYENPQHTGAPMKTPWNSVAPPSPEGHRDWMIAFNPVVDSIAASVKAAGGFGQLDLLDFWPFEGAIEGKLYLWAFNPTVGITPQFSREVCGQLRKDKTPEEKLPVHCKIRPNTMPRKAGDLLDFFSPLFDSYRGGLLKHVAPYYNPNSEYLAPFVERGEKLLQWAKQKLGRDYSQPKQACDDLKGSWKKDRCLLPLPEKYREILDVNETRQQECKELKAAGHADQCQLPIGRQQIPRQVSEVDRVNAGLRFFNLPEIGRRRGTIIDWGSTDLMQDIDRLRAMKHKPYAVAYLQLKQSVLPLPIGDLQVDDKTKIKVEYFAKPVKVPDLDHPGRSKWEAQVGLRVTLSPLRLAKTNLRAAGFHIVADGLKAKELQVEIPNILGMNDTQPQTRLPITAKIIGGTAQGLHLTDQHGDVDIAMDTATLQELNFRFDYPTLLFGSEEDKQYERAERLRRNEDQDCSTADNPCHEPHWQVSLKGLQGSGLKVGVPQIQGLDVAQFSIPTLEVSQQFKTQENATVSDVLTVDIPALNSKGSMDLDFNEKDGGNGKGTAVHLEGDSVLENVHLTSHFMGNYSLLQGSFDLSGTIERATLTKDNLGEVSFTTKTNGHPVKPLSGHISLEINNPAQAPHQKERPKGPPPKFDLDLDLPYVGFESQGDFTMAPGSATIRNGRVELHGKTKITGTIEGELNIQDASYQHKKTKGVEFGRLDLFPILTGIRSKGKFKFELLEDGFHLSKGGEDGTEPLSLGFGLRGTTLHHSPDLSKKSYSGKAQAEVIQTNLHIDGGRVEVQDFRGFEVRNLTVEGETQLRATHFKSGPIFLHQLEGSGKVWIDSVAWGLFQYLFSQLGGTPTGKTQKLPDARALTSHLPEEYKKKLREDLGGGDFIYAGGILFDRKEEKDWMARARDLIFNIHEQDGLGQYAMLRFPQVTFGMIGKEMVFLPPTNFLANIYVNVPGRMSASGGGFIRIDTPDRWREALKKEKE